MVQVKVPRGETNGAVLVLNSVTIQAGERDLMEVRLNPILVPAAAAAGVWHSTRSSAHAAQHKTA